MGRAINNKNKDCRQHVHEQISISYNHGGCDCQHGWHWRFHKPGLSTARNSVRFRYFDAVGDRRAHRSMRCDDLCRVGGGFSSFWRRVQLVDTNLPSGLGLHCRVDVGDDRVRGTVGVGRNDFRSLRDICSRRGVAGVAGKTACGGSCSSRHLFSTWGRRSGWKNCLRWVLFLH